MWHRTQNGLKFDCPGCGWRYVNQLKSNERKNLTTQDWTEIVEHTAKSEYIL